MDMYSYLVLAAQLPKHSIAGMGLFVLLCYNLFRWLSYNRFSGAEFANVSAVGAVWIVPCDLEVNLTFKIGGVRYPIHPFDATLYVSGFFSRA